MPRYLTRYVSPISGLEKLGTGPDAGMYHNYASVKNLLRFSLSRDIFPPGDYNIYLAPEGYVYGEKFICSYTKREDGTFVQSK